MIFFERTGKENAWKHIEESIALAEKQFGIYVTIHDCRGFLRRSDGSHLLTGRNLHPHPYCISGRQTTPGWDNKCTADCVSISDSIAGKELKPFIKDCWKGVYELVVPVARENVHIISIFAGAFRKEDTDTTAIFNLLNQKQQAMYKALPVIDNLKLESYSRILQLIGQGIVQCVNEFHHVSDNPSDKKCQIINFIHYNAHKPVKLDELAKKLCLSPSRTSHLVKELLGQSFQELLMEERMLRARALLSSSNQTLDEVALAVGIQSPHYFNRIFKRYFGHTPGKYRSGYFG